MAVTRRFYETIGFAFVEERHGTGPDHLSAQLGTVVIELYPASASRPPENGLRIGLTVDDVDAVTDALTALGSSQRDSSTEVSFVDPDGRVVAITQATPVTSDPRIAGPNPISLADALAFAEIHELSILPEYQADDGWIRCRVHTNALHNIYGPIGPLDAQKGERLRDMALRLSSGQPLHDELFVAKTTTPRVVKAIVVYRSTNDILYVGDGNKRALNACIHGEEWIDAILVPVNVADWTE